MRLHKLTLLVILTLLLTASSASAWQVNEYYKNNTGQDAYDLTKFIEGPSVITEAMRNRPFPDFQQVPLGGVTLGHWYDITGQTVVEPGQTATACFSTNMAQKPEVYAAYWTRADGSFIGPAGPAMAFDIALQGNHVALNLNNQWQYWSGVGYPPEPGDGLDGYIGSVNVIDVKFAVDSFNTIFQLEDLDSTLLLLYEFTDIPELEGILDTTEIRTHVDTTIHVKGGYTVLYYFSMQGPFGEEAYNMIAWEVVIPFVPATTNWGLAVLLILLIGTSIYLYVRRSRLVT